MKISKILIVLLLSIVFANLPGEVALAEEVEVSETQGDVVEVYVDTFNGNDLVTDNVQVSAAESESPNGNYTDTTDNLNPVDEGSNLMNPDGGIEGMVLENENYTVTVINGDVTSTVAGNSTTDLTTVLSEVGIEGDVKEITSSNPDLVSVECDDAGSWTLTSKAPFESDEQLTITMAEDGEPIVLQLSDPEEVLVDLKYGNVTINDNAGTDEQPVFNISGKDRNGQDIVTTMGNNETVHIVQTDSSTESTSNVISVAFSKAKSVINLIFDKLNIKTDYGITPVSVIGSGLTDNENEVRIKTVGTNTITAGDNYTKESLPKDTYHDNYGIFISDTAESITTTITSAQGGSLNVTAGDVNALNASNPQNTRALFSHGPIVLDNANVTLVSGNTPYNGYANSNAIYSWHKISIKNNSTIKAFSGDGSVFGVIRSYADGIDINDSKVQVYAFANDESGVGTHNSFRETYPNMTINGYAIDLEKDGNINIVNSEVYIKTGTGRFNTIGIINWSDNGKINIDNSNVHIETGDAEYTQTAGIVCQGTNSSLSVVNGSNLYVKVGKAGYKNPNQPYGWSIGVDGPTTLTIKDSNVKLIADNKGETQYMTYAVGYYDSIIFEGETNSEFKGIDYSLAAYTTTGFPSFLDKYEFFDGSGKQYTEDEVLIENIPYLIIRSIHPKPAPDPTPSDYTETENKITIPVEDGNTVRIEGIIEGEKVILADISEESIKYVLAGDDATGEIVIACSNLGVKTSKVELSPNSINNIAASDATMLTVEMSLGSITLDKLSVNTVAKLSDGSSIVLVIEDINNSFLNTQQKQVVDSKENVVALIDSYVLLNSSKIKKFDGGKATITFSKEVISSNELSLLHVWEIAEDGAMKEISYEIIDGEIVFQVEMLSTYVITRG